MNFTEEEWGEFYKTIGKFIFNSPAVACHNRHTNPLYTIRDYFDPSDADTPHAAAGRFVKDFSEVATGMGKGQRESLLRFATKWHGEDPAGKCAKAIGADLSARMAALKAK